MTVQRDALEEEIDELCSELDDIFVEACDTAEDAGNYSGKIKRNNIDWSRINPLIEQYTVWYHSAEVIISEYLPKREPEFEQLYQSTDELLHFDYAEYKKVENYKGVLARFVRKQTSYLRSIPRKLDIERLKVRKSISDRIVSDELLHAKDLWDEGDVRASGVVAGVALERHLYTLCEISEKEMDYGYMDGIASLATTLESSNEITLDEKKQLEWLGDIRNKCAHATEEEPETRKVEMLIEQADEMVQTL